MAYYLVREITQGGSNMTGTDLCVNKPQSVPVIFEPPRICYCLCFMIVGERCLGLCIIYSSQEEEIIKKN